MKMRIASAALVLAVSAAAMGLTREVASAADVVPATQPAAVAPLGGIAQIMEQGLKSLVVVEYTLRNENASHEEVGQGIVVDEQAGVVIVAGAFVPEGVPMEWVKDIKIRVPKKKFTTIPATFLGRTANRLFAYVKATGGGAALDTPALGHSQTGKVTLGREVMGVGRFEKEGGYEPYTGIGRIRATLRLTHDIVFTQTFGLTRGNSPVYDTQTGALVGITLPAMPETMVMSMGGNAARVQLKDDDQAAAFLPWEEVKDAFTEVPKEVFDARRPWLGIDGSTGMDEDLRTKYGIEQIAGLSVGSVIPGMPADQAGLKSTDIILTVDGKEFSESPVPDLMMSHFSRALERTKIGQDIKLGILREGKTKMELTVKMAANPKIGTEYPLTFNTKVGISTRDLAFNDTYSRKLPENQKGVMIALVKQGAPASLGATALKQGFLITRLNDQEVENQKQFAQLLETATADAEQKEVVFRVIRPDGETQVCRIDLTK